MEAPEVPLESVQEEIHHRAHGNDPWVTGVALTAAILAVLAAIASLLAGYHSNEAVIKQIEASNQWNYYQAKSIKRYLFEFKMETMAVLSKEAKEHDIKKVEEYITEGKEIMETAKDREKESAQHLRRHVILARSVTMFQVAIAIAAISVLTRRKPFWYAGIAFGAIGLGFMIQGIL